MTPNLEMNEPQGGQRVSATTIRNIIKNVKALEPCVGWGMRISKNSNGVMYSLDKSVIPAVSKGKPMPFDASLLNAEDSSATIKFLEGRLFYGVGNSWTEIPRTGMSSGTGGDWWEVNAQIDGSTILGIVCTQNGGMVPDSFKIGTISDPSDEAWVNEQGLHYYPLLRFVEGAGGYEGPYAFSVTFPPAGEGQAPKTYYAIQCHHGDVFYEYNSNPPPFVARVVSGTGGTYSIEPVTGESGGITEVNVVEIAGTATLPPDSRIIVHPIYAVSLPSGSF